MANDLEQKIIRQVEYYFGDINMPRDKFMQEKIQEDDGWISLDVLLSFKRLADLSTDATVIADALKKSTAQLVVVSEDGTKFKRSPDLPIPEMNDQRRKDLMARTAYAKGFPLDENLDDIVIFLEPQGPVESVTRRTYVDKISNDRKFKGSCFIIFKEADVCKKFIEGEELKYKDTALIRKWQADYFEEKKKEIENRKRNKQEKQQKAAALSDQKKPTFPKGALLHFTGIEEEQSLTREDIKEKVMEIGKLETSYIDFNKGDLQGYIRLPEENAAVDFHKKLTEGKLQIGEVALTMRVLEGEEEEEFLKKAADSMTQRREKQKGNKRMQRKRKGNFSDDGPKKKN